MAFWIFQNIVITTALAAAVAMVCRTGRIGPVARHALWVLVLVKFVTPPLVVWPWAAPDPFGIATIDARTIAELVEATPNVEPMPLGRDAVNPTDLRNPRNLTNPRNPRNPTNPRDPRLWSWLLGVWAAGSLSLFALEGVRLVRLARRIRLAAAADPEIVSRVHTLAVRLGVRPVPVVMVAGGGSPVVWGFGRPVLLWPMALSADSTDACIDGLLVHELAHVKRGDHLVGWIELAAGIVWWWNPLFWFVRSALREQAELACDAWVISALPNGRRAYAESLLALSGAAIRGASSLSTSTSMAAVGIRATSRRVLERRLVMIMKGRAPLRLPMVGLLCLALVGAATLPAWATAQQAPPPPPTPPAPVVAKPVQPPPPPPPAPVAPERYALRTRLERQNPPPPPPQPPQPVQRKAAVPSPNWTVRLVRPANLTPEGLQVIDAFEKEREAIQAEVDQKVKARRDAAVKALEDLQAQYAKAGKLDEAVAIRDYLRAGGPGGNGSFPYRKIVR